MRITPKIKDKVEINVLKKQEKEKFKFSHTLHPKPNQRCFELDIESMTVKESEYFIKTDTINYLDVVNNKVSTSERSVIIKDNHDYVIKLNISNALKHFRKQWNNNSISIHEDYKESVNILSAKLKKVNFHKNNE